MKLSRSADGLPSTMVKEAKEGKPRRQAARAEDRKPERDEASDLVDIAITYSMSMLWPRYAS
jgi:hypothetical protein